MLKFLCRLATVLFFPVALAVWLLMLYTVIFILPAELVWWVISGYFFDIDPYFNFILFGYWSGYFGHKTP